MESVFDRFLTNFEFSSGVNTAADVANLVAKAFSTTNNRGKPDLFSLIQKGLQAIPSSAPSTSSEEQNKQTEKRQTAENLRDYNHDKDRSEEVSSSTTKEKNGVNLSTTQFVTNMLRMVGFDATKLGALAINVLIMVASTIGTTLLGNTRPQRTKDYYSSPTEYNNAETGPEEQYSPNDHQPRELKEGTPLDWFLQNPSNKMKTLLDQAIDSNLSDRIIDMIESYETEEGRTSCVKMLMCKSSPFIWGMQKSLKQRIRGDASDGKESMENKKPFNVESFYAHMPSVEEFREHSAKCDQLYSEYCNTTNLQRPQRR
ncbi:uncharacterized protein LOC106081686 [Stomoxys calcitrans]|uniref:uncharacterized protein LOC106081686 n=1 Tax=Stomoxys calcitrans TaxID=35570 RepID=UPI0027E24344|nr:uncharacterized protein LOC106081686 [Stomoxys calcitrans]